MLAQFILFLLILDPHHEFFKNEDKLHAVVKDIEEIGAKRDLEPSFLAHAIFREASFDEGAIGKSRGEVGYSQAHGKARRTCEAAGYDLSTPRGGIECMGLLLDMGRRYCGSLEKGVRYYMSGSCHIAKQKAKDRLESWQKGWRRIVDQDFGGDTDRLVAWRGYLKRKAKQGVSDLGG